MNLKTILEHHAGIVMDRQRYLADLLGGHDWGCDTESGQFYFEGPGIETPFELIGSLSHTTGEWLWAWANASLPGEIARVSHTLNDYGKTHGIVPFTEDRFTPGDNDLHAFGIAACGIGGAKAYYIADYGDGTLLAAFPEAAFMDAWKPEHARVFSVFPRLIQMFELNHKAALEHYLAALGYELSHAAGFAARKDGQGLTAEFDDQDRLTQLQGEGEIGG